MSEESKHPEPENPEQFSGLHLGKPSTSAAGMTAVLSSVKHVLNEMNVGRGLKALQAINQKDGFDCPGCAWPDPDDERSKLGEFCENGAKAVAEESTTRVLMADFFQQHSVSSLSQLTDFEIGKKGRVGTPVYLPAGADYYQAISWPDAFALIAKHLNALRSPDEAIFYTSGRTSNEAAFLYQLFVREFGTNNLPDCSNMCHESSGVALMEALGTGKGSVTLEDFYKTEVIIILGQNPGTNHPRMLTALQRAKRNGAKIIAINPLHETGLISFKNPQTVSGMLGMKTELADIHLPVKINGDMALIQAMELMLLEEDIKVPGSVLDHEFINQHTYGFDALSRHLRNQSLEALARISGVSVEHIRQAADLIKGKRKIIACWAMGLTQHKNAVDTIKEIVNLLMMKGSLGKEGAGTCPVRGHSNVQGDRTMGIYEKPADSFLDKLDSVFGIRAPRAHGYDVVKSITAMHEGKAKVFVAMGGNFLSASPDTLFTAQALEKCDLTVHVSTKLNRSHLVHGKKALILPCLGRSDRDDQSGRQQFVTCENSMSVVQMSKGSLKPVSDQLLSEPMIVCRLAEATLGSKSKIKWDKYTNYDAIRDDIARVIPGFEDYNNKVKKPGGFYLGNQVREHHFHTDSAKANFTVSTATEHKLKADELMMMTIRTHDQFNTTIYGLDDRYRGIFNERRVILMNEKDISQRRWKPGDVVDIHNDFGGVQRVARKFIIVPYDIPEKCVATYFPETNVLVPVNSTADKSNTPTSKTVVVRLRWSE